jgi:hypothetical protein
MLSNGSWREEQRRKDISKYQREEDAETSALQTGATSSQFIKPMLNKAAETDTIESMIRKKKFSNQRSYDAMEKNFVRR